MYCGGIILAMKKLVYDTSVHIRRAAVGTYDAERFVNALLNISLADANENKLLLQLLSTSQQSTALEERFNLFLFFYPCCFSLPVLPVVKNISQL